MAVQCPASLTMASFKIYTHKKNGGGGGGTFIVLPPI